MCISEPSLNLDLPLTHTLQWLKLRFSTLIWMLGRTFKVLREFRVFEPPDSPESHSGHEGLQVGLPACTKLALHHCPTEYHRVLACSNVQTLYWDNHSLHAFELAVFNSFHDFLFNLSCL